MDLSRRSAWQGAQWRRSSKCASNKCVEIAAGDAHVGVRDSERSADRILEFAPQNWRNFLSAVRRGRFDLA